MTKLADIQIQLLTEAAAADSGSVLPSPEHARSAAGLIKRGFAIASPQPEGPSRLLITAAGRAAIAVEDGPAAAPPEYATTLQDQTAPQPQPSRSDPAPPEAKPLSKLQILVGLLRRPDGAAIQEMMSATGWQAHSVRGALSGSIKKGMGIEVVSEKTDNGRRYRIADAKGAAA